MKTLILIASLACGAAALASGVHSYLHEQGGEAALTFWGDGTKRSSTEYVDGVKQGRSEQWYVDGTQEWLGSYRDGFREGEWRFWDESGALDSERSGLYERGKRVAPLAE